MFVYADNAATTALSPAALRTMTAALQDVYGNPSSLHRMGRVASAALRGARETMAKYLGAKPEEIYFTGCGTEADNWALRSAAYAGAKQGKRHLISSAIEHHAILHTLPVYDNGIVHAADVEAAIRADTALVSIMYANNEIGTIQPVAEIGKICREKGVPFHTDAVQAAGHLPINVAEQNIDMLSLSGHKFHAPKGVGLLYCRKGVRLTPFIEGGAQERNKRAGTEALPSIMAMAAAFAESCENMRSNAEYVTALREKLIAGLEKIPFSRLTGDRRQRLPGIVSFCFEGIEGESLLLRLDMAGICASSGSACTSGSLDPSHVLLALGLPHEIAHGSLRLSLCEYNTEEEVDFILEQVPQVVRTLREMSPVWGRMMEQYPNPYQD